MHVAMHALNVAIDGSRSLSDRERSGPCHRPDQFPAVCRHEPEEQLRRCKTDPRPLFSTLECISSTTLNIFERCYFERHSFHFNVSMLQRHSRNLLIVSQGLRSYSASRQCQCADGHLCPPHCRNAGHKLNPRLVPTDT